MTTTEPLFNSDGEWVAALKRGDESAFTHLVNQYWSAMVRVANLYLNDVALAEEVTQESWLAVLRGLERFEGRSSFKTWLFTILSNRAKTRAAREKRYVPLVYESDDEDEPSVALDRFNPPDAPRLAGHWAAGRAPQPFAPPPEQHLLSQETLAVIEATIEALPPGQRTVIRLRDVEGFSAAEVCNILDITETNQRVLLHRARSKVRQALETYFAG